MTIIAMEALRSTVLVGFERPEVLGPLTALADHLGAPIAARPAATPEGQVIVIAGGPDGWEVDLAGTSEPFPAGLGHDLEPLLLAALTRAFLSATPLLCVHAGVVAAADGLAVIPGPSGHGKSTAVAALVQAGWGYVSDEVLAVDPADGSIHPFPRPLALDGESWSVLGLAGSGRPPDGGEALVPVTAIGSLGNGGAVRHVLLTERRPGPTTATRGSTGEALAALLRSSFNHYKSPRASLDALLRLLRGAVVWDVQYGDAAALARDLSLPSSQDWADTPAR